MLSEDKELSMMLNRCGWPWWIIGVRELKAAASKMEAMTTGVDNDGDGSLA
jgi:hypothetical protein